VRVSSFIFELADYDDFRVHCTCREQIDHFVLVDHFAGIYDSLIERGLLVIVAQESNQKKGRERHIECKLTHTWIFISSLSIFRLFLFFTCFILFSSPQI
jgi:hypothetical protein